MTSNPILLAIRPERLARVIDLVSEAGLDVSDWANFSRGPGWAAANPKYCYEWAFHQGDIVVVNLWLEDFGVEDDLVFFQSNIRTNAEVHARPGGKAVWRKRAEALDQVLQLAFSRQLPVRVIVCRGKLRDRSDPRATKSRVEARSLDPVPWAVTRYDTDSGDCKLVRGASPPQFVDQYTWPVGNRAPDRHLRMSTAYVRSRAIRDAALQRAMGRCEFCGEEGFLVSSGSRYLETHHILPLCDDGPDEPWNVAALCANHHREAHSGARMLDIRDVLLEKLGARQAAI